jgi:hypothetical protein
MTVLKIRLNPKPFLKDSWYYYCTSLLAMQKAPLPMDHLKRSEDKRKVKQKEALIKWIVKVSIVLSCSWPYILNVFRIRAFQICSWKILDPISSTTLKS